MFCMEIENILQEQEMVKVPPLDNGKKIPWQVFLVVVILMGTITGYILARNKQQSPLGNVSKGSVIKTDKEAGISDEKSFRDNATGTVEKNDGKITDEGSHKLIRGDTTQTAYLTSSVIDLDQYVGKKVQVWGETFKGQRAGWLMDVGRIKILD